MFQKRHLLLHLAPFSLLQQKKCFWTQNVHSCYLMLSEASKIFHRERVDEFIDQSEKTSNKLQVIDKCIHQRNYLRSHHIQGPRLNLQHNGIASLVHTREYIKIQIKSNGCHCVGNDNGLLFTGSSSPHCSSPKSVSRSRWCRSRGGRACCRS